MSLLNGVKSMATNNKLTQPLKTLTWGVLAIVAACWFWLYLAGNPVDELALIRRAQIAAGSLVDTYENELEDNRGRVYLSDVGVYTYRVPDGREFKTTTRVPTGQLKERQEVEYLPDNPAVSRIRGDGCRSVVEWLWRKVGLGGLLLALYVSPGVVLIREAFRDIKRLRTATSVDDGRFHDSRTTKFKNPGIIAAKLVAAGMLFGALGRHQYGYYTLLRWVVCAVAGVAAFRAAEIHKSGWVWVLAIVALFFNPIIPLHLKRETWAFFDVGVAVLLLVSILRLDWHMPPP